MQYDGGGHAEGPLPGQQATRLLRELFQQREEDAKKESDGNVQNTEREEECFWWVDQRHHAAEESITKLEDSSKNYPN